MATEKRDRQRANREEKRAAEEKAAKRKHRLDLARRWAFYAVIFVIAILVLLWLTN